MNAKVTEMLLQQTSIDDLPDSMQPIAELIGIENLMKLCQYVSGDKCYFPIPVAILREARNRAIKEEYNGYNAAALAAKYELTKTQILAITK